MDELIKTLISKVEAIDAKVNDIRVTLGKQEVTLRNQQISLDEHIRRTNLLEEAMGKDISEVKRQGYWFEGVFKFLGLVGLITGIITAVIKWI